MQYILLGAINSILFFDKLNLKLSPRKGKNSCCVKTFPAIICWKPHPKVRFFIQPHKFCYDRPVYGFRRHFRCNSYLWNTETDNGIEVKASTIKTKPLRNEFWTTKLSNFLSGYCNSNRWLLDTSVVETH